MKRALTNIKVPNFNQQSISRYFNFILAIAIQMAYEA